MPDAAIKVDTASSENASPEEEECEKNFEAGLFVNQE